MVQLVQWLRLFLGSQGVPQDHLGRQGLMRLGLLVCPVDPEAQEDLMLLPVQEGQANLIHLYCLGPQEVP